MPEDGNAEESTEQAAGESRQEKPPLVFMTKDISPEGLKRIYEALNREATGKVAVKISIGEPGSHYLDANLIKDLVRSVDGNGAVRLPVGGGICLKENLVGANYKNYDFFIVLSHFKGHRMGGFGGAIINMSIEIVSASGKFLIHSAGVSATCIGSGMFGSYGTESNHDYDEGTYFCDCRG